jgi:hypothetical protein
MPIRHVLSGSIRGRAARKNHTVNLVIVDFQNQSLSKSKSVFYLVRFLENYPKKTSSATESGRDMDAGRGADLLAGGEKSSASIQPSASPAHRKVTAVGRS